MTEYKMILFEVRDGVLQFIDHKPSAFVSIVCNILQTKAMPQSIWLVVPYYGKKRTQKLYLPRFLLLIEFCRVRKTIASVVSWI